MSLTSQKLAFGNFWRIANNVLNKGKFAINPLFNGLEVLPSASNKAKLFAENFSNNSYLDDSGISLFALLPKTNQKLHNIPVISKLAKVITNLDPSKILFS